MLRANGRDVIAGLNQSVVEIVTVAITLTTSDAEGN